MREAEAKLVFVQPGDSARSVARRGAYVRFTKQETSTPAIETIPNVATQECIETFVWRDLRFHVVTRDPLTADQIRTIRRTMPKVKRVGLFAEVVAIVLGRHVQIRTERPSPDIRFEVGW